MFWGLISPVYYLRVGAPDVEPKSLILQREDLYLYDPSDCGTPHLGCGLFSLI